MKNTTKEEALNRLNAIENEQKELRRVIENFDNPKCITSYTDIKSLDDAEKVLEKCCNHVKYNKCDYPTEKAWNTYVLETIIKSINYLENGNKIWVPKLDGKEYMYTPYFKYDGINYSFSYDGYISWNTDSDVGFGWGFKTSTLAKYTGETFIKEYNNYLLNK